MERKSEPVSNGRKIHFDNSELVKTSFWVSQLLMVLATVLGVYLAAQQGLSQAIKFDSLVNTQNNYHLQRALYDEVRDNLQTLEAYMVDIDKLRPLDLRSLHPQLSDFVWQNMYYSANALETPAEILTAIRRFRIESAQLIEKMEKQELSRGVGTTRLRALVGKISADTLPKLQLSFQRMELELQRSGMDVNITEE